MAKISNTEFVKSGFLGLPSWAKGALTIGALAGGAFIVYKLISRFGADQRRESKQNVNINRELEEEAKANPLTFAKSQYSTFADTIQTAGFDLGTDEQAIYSVFYKLKNNADYLALLAAWGSPTRTIYDFGIPYKMTLPQFLRWEMRDSEITKINKILSTKKIKYRI
jgi:hypothetical protein